MMIVIPTEHSTILAVLNRCVAKEAAIAIFRTDVLSQNDAPLLCCTVTALNPRHVSVVGTTSRSNIL